MFGQKPFYRVVAHGWLYLTSDGTFSHNINKAMHIDSLEKVSSLISKFNHNGDIKVIENRNSRVKFLSAEEVLDD